MESLDESATNLRTVAPTNFRSCGRYAEPVKPCHKGTIRNPDAVPTIPSRIETVLFKGNLEKKGFGIRSMRFQQSHGEDVPAPGSYGMQKPFYQEVLDRSGWGKRGTGGFASRSRRFGARSMPQMPVAGRGVPGPGAYEPLPALETLKRPTDFNQAHVQGVFARPTDNPVRDRQRSLSAPAPGPGQYGNPNESKHDVVHMSAALAAFRDKSQRGLKMNPDTGLIPGPGQYIGAEGARTRPRTPLRDEPCNAVFQEPLKRRFTKIHPDLPAADERARRNLGDFAAQVAHECGGTQGEKALGALPGPGHYPVNRDVMWSTNEPGHAEQNGSSSFLPGPKRTDWATQEIRQKPGPGNYDPQQVPRMHLTDAKSAFVSQSEQRDFIKGGKNPGPCFYSPSLPKHAKSFHLNTKKRFM